MEVVNQLYIQPYSLIATRRAWSATQWNRGIRWLDESESIWVDLIGCNDHAETITMTYTVTPYNQYCGGYYTGSPEWVECIYNYCFGNLSGPQCAPYDVTFSYTQIRDYPSDGLLCEYTQIVNGIPEGNKYEAIGVNHNEQLNTGNKPISEGGDVMATKFREIFNRPINDFFRTEPR